MYYITQWNDYNHYIHDSAVLMFFFHFAVCSFGCDRGHDGTVHPGGGGGGAGGVGAAAGGGWGSARPGAPGSGGGAGAVGELHHSGTARPHPPPRTSTGECPFLSNSISFSFPSS